jgi:50S ribosomal subunit-associated GTPase HflX
MSALTGDGLPEFKRKLHHQLFKDHRVFCLRIPKSEKNTIHSFPKWSIVLKRRENRNDIELKVMAEPKAMVKFSSYILRGDAQW